MQLPIWIASRAKAVRTSLTVRQHDCSVLRRDFHFASAADLVPESSLGQHHYIEALHTHKLSNKATPDKLIEKYWAGLEASSVSDDGVEEVVECLASSGVVDKRDPFLDDDP